MTSSDEFEEDPFDYKPLKRRKIFPSQNKSKIKKSAKPTTSSNKTARNTPTQKKTRTNPLLIDLTQNKTANTASTQNKRTLNSPGPAPKRTKNRSTVKNTPDKVAPSGKSLKQLLENSRNDNNNDIVKPSGDEEVPFSCPVCQMPLSLLDGAVTPAIHINECEEQNSIRSVPCPHGISCRSKVKRHYLNFAHDELARHRALGFHDQTTAKLSDFPARLSYHTGSQNPWLDNSRSSDERVPSSTQNEGLVPPSSQNDGHVPPKSQNDRRVSPRSPNVERKGRSRPAPPIGCSTPINAEPYISPIKVTRRDSKIFTCDGCEKIFVNDSACRNHMKTCRQSSLFKSDVADPSLAQNDRTFDPELDAVINAALQNVNNDQNAENEGEIIIEGHSEVAGPSNFPAAARPVANVLQREGCDRSESPIKVTATKDSCELELSVEIQPNIQCTRMKVRVPLKKDANGEEQPIELATSYANRTTPKKQTTISQFFQRTPDKSTGSEERRESSSLGSSDFGVISLQKAKEQGKRWKDFFGNAKKKTVVAPDPVPQESSEEPSKGNEVKRKCPWYKKVQGTSISVDAFNFGEISGVQYYFLSHYHYDHYIGLNRRWKRKVYCSAVTGRLITKFQGVDPSLVVELDKEEPRVIGGVEVTCVDANHCPGSFMFIFRLTSGRTILHTGDFRASPEMESEAVFWNGRIDLIYLDTTYCRPEYNFPSQSDVVETSVALVTEYLDKNPKTLVLVGAYTIGKERIFKAIAEAMDAKIWAERKRLTTWQCLDDPEILSRVEKDKSKAAVHVVPMQGLNYGSLAKVLKDLSQTFDNVLGVKPTGWTHQKGATQENSLSAIRIKNSGKIGLLEVPYSEHSCYGDLKRFIMFLRLNNAKDIIPTVNLRQTGEMREMFGQWIEERKNLGPDSQ